MEKLREEYDIEIEYRPFLLRPDIGPEGAPRVQRPGSGSGRQHLMDMANEAGLTMQFRDHTSYSRLALEAQDYAIEHGKADAFHRAGFDAYWKDAKDLGNIEVVLELAASAGLDVNELRPLLAERKLQAKVEAQMDEARMQNISAVPTLIVGGKWAIEGAQPYEFFERVMREYVKAPKKETLS